MGIPCHPIQSRRDPHSRIVGPRIDPEVGRSPEIGPTGIVATLERVSGPRPSAPAAVRFLTIASRPPSPHRLAREGPAQDSAPRLPPRQESPHWPRCPLGPRTQPPHGEGRPIGPEGCSQGDSRFEDRHTVV